MGQYLLLNLNHCNISIKTQQRISKPGTSQTDRNVINEKFKEERIQHETFTYIVIDVNSLALYSCQRKEIAFLIFL